MEKVLLKILYDKVCLSFGTSCTGCPFWPVRADLGAACCTDFIEDYPKEAALALARFIAGDVALNKLAGPQAKTPEIRREILQAAERCVCGGRELDHGTPEQSFHAIARQWEAYLASRGLLKEGVTLNAWDAATMLALFKVARISVGNFVADSYVDGCGYLACAGELAGNEEKTGEKK